MQDAGQSTCGRLCSKAEHQPGSGLSTLTEPCTSSTLPAFATSETSALSRRRHSQAPDARATGVQGCGRRGGAAVGPGVRGEPLQPGGAHVPGVRAIQRAAHERRCACPAETWLAAPRERSALKSRPELRLGNVVLRQSRLTLVSEQCARRTRQPCDLSPGLTTDRSPHLIALLTGRAGAAPGEPIE